MTRTALSIRIWLGTWVTLWLGIMVAALLIEPQIVPMLFVLGIIGCFAGSLPALVIVWLTLGAMPLLKMSHIQKIKLFALVLLGITLLYGIVGGLIDTGFDLRFFEVHDFLQSTFIFTGILYACALIAFFINYKHIEQYFKPAALAKSLVQPFNPGPFLIENNQSTIHMETDYTTPAAVYQQPAKASNKVLIKAITTAFLIMGMMIPTFLISSLVTERKERNEHIIEEASARWASQQRLTGPYLAIPYKNEFDVEKQLIVLPEELKVNGEVMPVERERSIYKIISYRGDIKSSGNFVFKIPADVNADKLKLSDTKICVGISDFKGIEEKLAVVFNGKNYELQPGLPLKEIDAVGLSAPVELSVQDLQNNIAFTYNIKVKGTGRLYFMPLAGTSSFNLKSKWDKPSFDGGSSPAHDEVSDAGFTADWSFNKANLPFTTVLKDGKDVKENLAFGVNMLQPLDQYDKTTRCIKYAILFIGLTFSLFFLIEIMQKKPFHPVQYVLAGLGLVIFYVLLLSISEYIAFHWAYLIAAAATVLLISWYAFMHFKSWKTAAIFLFTLGGLYAFNYVLISLEDTALLIGSIALFIILAVVMYISRKVNWYGVSSNQSMANA